MAESTMRVKVSAEVSGFARDMHAATRDADRFAGQVSRMGTTLTRTGSVASQAAASLSNLSSVLPGLASGTARVAGALGTASMLLGETAVLGAGLTKTWALLTAASRVLAASLPAALAPLLANPWVLAIAGATLLATAIYGISNAWTASARAKQRYQEANKVLDQADARASFARDLALAAQQRQGLHAPAVGSDLDLVKSAASTITGDAASRVKLVVGEWKQVGDYSRTLTSQMIVDWGKAWTTVNEKIAALSQSMALATGPARDVLRQAIADLYELRSALKGAEIHTPTGPLTIQDAGRQIAPITAPGTRQGLRSLDPRQFLGNEMGMTPSDFGLENTNKMTNAFQEGWMQVKEAIATQLPMRLAALIVGRTPAGAVGGALGGAFGTGVGTGLGKGLGAGIGGSIGTAVLPIIGSIAGAFIGSKIGDLFGRHAGGASDALDRLALAAERAAAAITNAPLGFRMGSYTYTYGGQVPPDVPGTPTGPREGKRTGGGTFNITNLVIQTANPSDFVQQMSVGAERALLRGGTPGFQLAVSRAAGRV